ncbi:bifunctional phosphopantothenoylcysteine decarboxylase/phosphopantothenate--cysteine ligase CoaBC [Flaviflexus ciconiae]|uniref:Coenzyme A biosynthesis bifunctional protein CoaBC n=1 Tax=Flaviflexus ciconiae TaxID=2496867 RepID=A0A3Q9G118_9ACTO|nr:bifunctional phosphopantothenoylcysteine decarboxylase/phosphopantothenate--cysteine ligase CoaBC [Flaviflexus ciconiae]AZQ76525.1 bifunctional phosphopantothenoylcysteine decarboxylase/phosphopantothenate--cysteine ligase CoaBC [Flaviflexus ciconiae]
MSLIEPGAHGQTAGPSRIVLGVTGGIAAYKSAILARLLIKAGHDVQVVPTESALNMVGKSTFAALSGNPVHTSVFDDPEGVEHVQVGDEADLLVIAPATANTIAKLAHGIGDNLLTATALVATCPVLIAPAMHTQMWNHPATRANIQTLKNRGVIVIEPAEGRLTGADSGVGRLPEPEQIAQTALGLLEKQDLEDKRFVISAGGTREPIDPVRFLGNRSTGRFGINLALQAAHRGAHVDLVACNIDGAMLPNHPRITVHPVGSASQLQEAMVYLADGAQVLIMTAAVADFRPATSGESKFKKDGHSTPDITLVENPDILKGLASDRSHGAFVVGFAAETGDENGSVLDYGRKKAKTKGADLLVVNKVGETAGFGDVDTAITILDGDGEIQTEGAGTKSQMAGIVLDSISLSLS